MSTQLTFEDARESLNAHAAAKGAEIHAKYGPRIGSQELAQILGDPSCVRYPCELAFDSGPLQPGEFACALPKGKDPQEGYRMCVHPYFAAQPDRVPYLVLYHLVVVNYGEFASPDDAETFAAEALGLSKDEYYQAICRLADEIAPTEMSG